MEQYQISSCEKKRIITHHTIVDGKPIKYQYGDVRAGVSWPTSANAAPSFFVIIGQNFDTIDGLMGYSQLAEFQSDDVSPERFYNRMTDYATMYGIKHIFCDMSEHKSSYVDGFNGFASKIEGHLSLVEAPYSENFSFSVGILRDFWKKGVLGFLQGGKCTSQLRSLTEADLSEKVLEESLYAVNAARFVMGSFDKFPVLSLSNYEPERDWHEPGPNAWMAT